MGFLIVGISTGINLLTDRVEEDLKFDRIYSNILLSKNGCLTGRTDILISYDKKGVFLKKIAAQAGVKLEETIIVGDGPGDIPMAKLAGFSIAFNPSSKKLEEIVDYNCKTKDFREILSVVRRINGNSNKPNWGAI
jgi:phosphoserine phosphatase